MVGCKSAAAGRTSSYAHRAKGILDVLTCIFVVLAPCCGDAAPNPSVLIAGTRKARAINTEGRNQRPLPTHHRLASAPPSWYVDGEDNVNPASAPPSWHVDGEDSVQEVQEDKNMFFGADVTPAGSFMRTTRTSNFLELDGPEPPIVNPKSPVVSGSGTESQASFTTTSSWRSVSLVDSNGSSVLQLAPGLLDNFFMFEKGRLNIAEVGSVLVTAAFPDIKDPWETLKFAIRIYPKAKADETPPTGAGEGLCTRGPPSPCVEIMQEYLRVEIRAQNHTPSFVGLLSTVSLSPVHSSCIPDGSSTTVRDTEGE